MEFTALGERIMTTLNHYDPRCSALLFASSRCWPLEVCSSHRGQREEEEDLDSSMWETCPVFQHQQVNERQALPKHPWHFSWLAIFSLLIFVVLLGVCQAEAKDGGRPGHRHRMDLGPMHLAQFYLFSLVRDAQAVPHSGTANTATMKPQSCPAVSL